MRKIALLLILFLTHFYSFSQLNFEKGFIVNNLGEKIECLIKDRDWYNTPEKFNYKLIDDNEIRTGFVGSIKSFGVYNKYKYIRRKVNIDTLGNDRDDLKYGRNPYFKEKTIFLKVLIEGKANLYSYHHKNRDLFLYNLENSPIEQLVYKDFLVSKVGAITAKNNMYKQQLANSLICESIPKTKYYNLDYSKNELIKLFINYNKCTNSNYVNYEFKNPKKTSIHLSLKSGINKSSFSTESNSGSSGRNTESNKSIGLTFGIELEVLLPYNRNKWSIIIDPNFHKFNGDGVSNNGQKVKAEYTSLQIPFGFRHYMYISQNSKFFINAFYILDTETNDSKLNFIANDDFISTEIDLITDNNFGIGIGLKHKKYSLEIKYSNRNILNKTNWYSKYHQTSFIVGYQIF